MPTCRLGILTGCVTAIVLTWLSPSVELVAAQATAASSRTLLAAVMSSQGRPVVDVGLDDFVVTEGGQSREILDAHIADYPLAIVIDDRAEVAESGQAIRAAARRFIQRVGERPIALFRLTGAAAPLTTLDDDRTVVLEKLETITFTATPSDSPLETLARGAAVLHDSGSPFSAVVVIAGAPVDANALVRGERLPQIIDSGASVHVVQAQRSQPATSVESQDPDLLRLIVEQTHGQFTPIFSSASYTAALDRLADRLAIEMMVQYLVPPGPKVGDVQVGVRLPGARVVGLGVK